MTKTIIADRFHFHLHINRLGHTRRYDLLANL